MVRLYHSVALLLPDGRVVAAGGNPPPYGDQVAWEPQDENEELQLDVYSPPYLFAEPRPTISAVPTEWGYGQKIDIASPQAGDVKWLSLIRCGSTTHAFDNSQRLVDMEILGQGGGTVRTVAPDERTWRRRAGTCSSWWTRPGCRPSRGGRTSPDPRNLTRGRSGAGCGSMPDGAQRTRPLLRRNRPVVLAHGRPHASRPAVRHRAPRRRPARPDRPGRGPAHGSLGATGHGHGSDRAVLLGLEGEDPETVDTEHAVARVATLRAERSIRLAGTRRIDFDPDGDLTMHRRTALPGHPNGMTFEAFDGAGTSLVRKTYYSVGGGFVVDEVAAGADRIVEDATVLPHPFRTGAELLARCHETGGSIAQVMAANERAWRTDAELRAALLHIWDVMQECVENGCTRADRTLPGGLKVPRRAPELRERLRAQEAEATRGGAPMRDPLWAMEWVDLYALAVNEENASGGRIVTAPTNGAAGIVPAVLHFYTRFVEGADDDGQLSSAPSTNRV